MDIRLDAAPTPRPARARTASVLVALALALAGCGNLAQGSRDFVRAVGSSTVYPFAAAVAERVARRGGKSPVIESTGTGAGLRLFCAGVGPAYPDVADASRRIKSSELAQCHANGVTEVVEIQVGIDGIAFAQSREGGSLSLTLADVYKALAARPFGRVNTAHTWHDVNPALPALAIQVYGPPSTSGTRDAVEDLIMVPGCKSDPRMAAIEKSDASRFNADCKAIREDGAYVDAGENDNLIVQKISENPRAIGIFGYSFLEENPDKLRGISMAGIAPSYASIADFSYPGARPLYIYVKKQHLNAVKGLAAYVAEWPRAWGPDGYLKAQGGMVVAPEAVRARNAAIAMAMTPLDAAALAPK